MISIRVDVLQGIGSTRQIKIRCYEGCSKGTCGGNVSDRRWGGEKDLPFHEVYTILTFDVLYGKPRTGASAFEAAQPTQAPRCTIGGRSRIVEPESLCSEAFGIRERGLGRRSNN
jgi:hypothetical protein